MNKYKKLVLSLTISLLSFAGVWALAIPQFKTYREFSNYWAQPQFSASAILSNKQVSGPDKPGLLEGFIESFDKLPKGTIPQAENFIRSKFGANWSSAKLKEKLFAEKGIATTIAQTRKLLAQEKASFQKLSAEFTKETNKFTKETNKLRKELDSYKGKYGEYETIEEDYERLYGTLHGLENLVETLEEKQEILKEKIAELRKQGATPTQLAPLQKQLDDANAEIKDREKIIANHAAEIKKLEARITELEKLVSPGQAWKALSEKYDALIQEMKNYNATIPEKVKLSNGKVVDLKDDTEIIGLTVSEELNKVIDELKDTIPKLEKSEQLMTGEAKALADEWTAIEKRWTDPKETAEKAQATLDQAQKAKEIDAEIDKVKNKIQQFHARQEDAENRKIIVQINAIDKEFEDFYGGYLEDKIIGTEIKNLIGHPDIIRNFNEKGELQKASDRLKEYIKAANEKQKKLSAELLLIKTEIDDLSDATQKNDREVAFNKIEKEQYKTLAEEIRHLKAEIDNQIGQIPVTPPNGGGGGGGGKPEEVTDVAVDLNNYTLTFKIGDIEFKSDATDIDDKEFIKNIVDPKITEAALTTAGEELAKQAKTPQELRTIANDLLRAELDKATTDEQRNKIRMLVKPILVTYRNAAVPPDKDPVKDKDFWTNNSEYKDILKGYYGSNIPADLQ